MLSRVRYPNGINIMKKRIKIITHSGHFHSDDVFAVASVIMFLNKFEKDKAKIEVIRTREKKVIEKGDYVIDVGGINDPRNNRFDHHMSGGAGSRKNGVPYASFGLVWKKFGEKIAGSKEVARLIEKKIVEPIDALDNGLSIYENIIEEVYPYILQDIVYAFNPSWKENETESTKSFLSLVDLASVILEREITKISHAKEAEKFVEKAYKKAEDKKIIILEEKYPWEEVLMKYKEPLYVIYPDRDRNSWRVKAIPKKINSFENRKDLPKSWAGKLENELPKITGIPDALFCHKERFLASALTKESALKLAELALKA